VEVRLGVLDAVDAPGVVGRKLEPVYDAALVEDLAHDLGDGQVLKDPAAEDPAEPPQARDDGQPQPPAVVDAPFLPCLGLGDHAVEEAGAPVAQLGVETALLPDQARRIDVLAGDERGDDLVEARDPLLRLEGQHGEVAGGVRSDLDLELGLVRCKR